MEAWLAEAETVLLTAQTQLDDQERMLKQQCDVRVARAEEAYEQTMQEAHRVRERAVQVACQERDTSIATVRNTRKMREMEEKIQACQERDTSIATVRNTRKMREMEEKIQAVRVEAQEWRQMATLLQGQGMPAASASAPAPPAGASNGNECVVCTDNPASFVIVPCGHVCLCEGCRDALLARGGDCPICRGAISTTCKVFL